MKPLLAALALGCLVSSASATGREPSYIGVWRPAGMSCRAPEEALTSYTRYAMGSETRTCRILRVDGKRPKWVLTLDCKSINDQRSFSIEEEVTLSPDGERLSVTWQSPDLASGGDMELHRCR